MFCWNASAARQVLARPNGRSASPSSVVSPESPELPLPKKLDAEHQSLVDNLKGKSGAEFDSTYAQHMASDHAEAITLFEDATQLGDQEFASFAKKTLPTLREHKRMADRLAAH